VEIYEEILKKNEALFTCHQVDNDVVVTVNTDSRLDTIAKLIAIALSDFTYGRLTKHRLISIIFTQFDYQITTEDMVTVLKQNSESFNFDEETDIVQVQ